MPYKKKIKAVDDSAHFGQGRPPKDKGSHSGHMSAKVEPTRKRAQLLLRLSAADQKIAEKAFQESGGSVANDFFCKALLKGLAQVAASPILVNDDAPHLADMKISLSAITALLSRERSAGVSATCLDAVQALSELVLNISNRQAAMEDALVLIAKATSTTEKRVAIALEEFVKLSTIGARVATRDTQRSPSKSKH
jgi:hypothetical protein